METLWGSIYKDRMDAAVANPEDPESIEFQKMFRSASHLGEHFEEYPLILFAFSLFLDQGDVVKVDTRTGEYQGRVK